MRPGLGRHPPGRSLLDPVVSDRRGCVEGVRDVPARDVLDEAGTEGVPHPETGVAVRLELEPDLPALRACIAICAPERACQVLDVVAVLVREDVRLGEHAASRAELRLEIVEEPEIDVHVPVLRAIERPHGGGCRTTTGLDAIGEEPRTSRGVVAQTLRPVRLHAVDHRDDAAVLPCVRIRARATVGLEVGRLGPWADGLPRERAEIADPAASAAEQEKCDQHDHADQPATAERDRHSSRTPATPVVLDLRRVEASVLAKAHPGIFTEPTRAPRARIARMLHEPARHEPVTDQPWDEEGVLAAVRRIVADADAGFGAAGIWPLHELDSGDKDDDWAGITHGVYLGAAGMVSSLDRLTRAGVASSTIDLRAAAGRLHDGYVVHCHAPDEPIPGIWTGEAGVHLVAELLAPDPARADALLAVVRANTQNPTHDLFWGAAGTMLAAYEMLARSGEECWAETWRQGAEALLAAWESDSDLGCRLWTQVIEGRSTRYLGAAHGFAGTIASLLRGLELLSAAVSDEIVRAATRTVVATAVVEDGHANWPVSAGGALDGHQGVRTQWCHGAPGIITSVAALPADPELDALLLAGGELTWHAGPLAKGAGLCHGTAGNGLAFLALFARTGDELWLSRARAFAVHALDQVDRERKRYGGGRFSLWTGDLGAALYAWQCIDGSPAVPALDAW